MQYIDNQLVAQQS